MSRTEGIFQFTKYCTYIPRHTSTYVHACIHAYNAHTRARNHPLACPLTHPLYRLLSPSPTYAQGRKFDKTGKRSEWWDKNTVDGFTKKAQCISDQFSTYTIHGDKKVSGELTLGEDIADSGGYYPPPPSILFCFA